MSLSSSLGHGRVYSLMKWNGSGIVSRVMAALIAMALPLVSTAEVHAEGETAVLESSEITSEFPEGFRVKVQASGEKKIEFIAIRLKIGEESTGVYEYLCQDRPGEQCEAQSGDLVNSELFWRTDTLGRYIPPGTLLRYNFEIQDSDGGLLQTEQEEFIYHDARFTWEEVSEGSVAVAYHGPVRTRAQLVLDTIAETLDLMGPILGAESTEPIRVTMYNNIKEMLEALPPRSTTISRELITEGQAFSRVGTLLVLGGGRMPKGTASHEVSHIIIHRAADSVFRTVPPWINEGLAEYGNVDPGFSYDIALEFALGTDRLLPVVFMESMPGNPEDIIIFYGQSRNIIRMMIERFGAEKMKELMSVLKSGKKMDDALEEVYGIDRLELTNMWRKSVGAPEYVLPDRGRARPTRVPMREILPYSLTPQPETEAIGDVSDAPVPTPTATPEPPPTPTTAPEPAATVAPKPEPPTATGLSCGAAIKGGTGALDLTTVGLLLGLAGLAFRRRRLD